MAKFCDLADKIEKMLKTNESQDIVISEIYKLSKLSFCKQTGTKVNLLAKMAEMKYNVVLLKS